jgi:hypothetical protein
MTREQIDNLAMIVGPFVVLEPRAVLDEALVALAFDPDTQSPSAVYDLDGASMLMADADSMDFHDAREFLLYNNAGQVVWLHELECRLEA